MKKIPKTKTTPVLRTDFSNEGAWKSICAKIRKPVGGFRAYVEFISDKEFDGVSSKQLIRLLPKGFDHNYMFVVDEDALSQKDHPILVVNLWKKSIKTFRVIPSEMWCVENNLTIANMDFEDFTDAVDVDGVFRGFY